MQFTNIRLTLFNLKKNFKNLKVNFENSYSVKLSLRLQENRDGTHQNRLWDTKGYFMHSWYDHVPNRKSDIAGKLNIHPENRFCQRFSLTSSSVSCVVLRQKIRRRRRLDWNSLIESKLLNLMNRRYYGKCHNLTIEICYHLIVLQKFDQ